MWVLVVHGGAKKIEPEEEAANRGGIRQALAAGRRLLERGASAVEVAEAVVQVLEDDPTFNAARGAVKNRDGEIELSASLMAGDTLRVGAVGALMGVRHPISVARKMLDEEEVLIVGEGAREFAVKHEAALCEPSELEAGNRESHDTVGCVALDREGLMAVGTSTGGLQGSWPGRIGDSPQPGCGFFADNRVGAVAFSGDGEEIARGILAARVIFNMDERGPQSAVEFALEEMERTGGEAGGIAVDVQGRVGWAHNSPHFAVGISSDGGEDEVYLCRGETA